MDMQKALSKAIDKFKFVDEYGNEFWTPYLINDIYIEDSKALRGLGKSSPEDIIISVNYIKNKFPGISGKEIRLKLIDGSLPEKNKNYKAIDCSGFVFYVMCYFFKDAYGEDLTNIIGMPREAVLNGALNYVDWNKAHKITQEEIDNMPENVPLSWVVETYGRKPANLCNVKALTSDHSSTPVKVADIQVGDLVQMVDISHNMPHIGVVTATGEQVEVYHSGRINKDDVGGVRRDYLPFVDGKLDCTKVHSPHMFLEIRRLKSDVSQMQ
jgi:hypothetical protein